MKSAPRSPNGFLSALAADDFELIRPYLRTADLVQDFVLVEVGETLKRAYMPHRGVISLVVNLTKGEHVQVAMIGRDSVFRASAALDDGISSTDAVVLLPGTASVIDVAVLRASADRSAVLRSLLARHEQALFTQAQQSAVCNASHSVEARLSRWLLRARDLCDSETLPLTQELLAQLIGVQRNAVSIVAHALQRAGIIRYSRGHIDIKNPQGLRETSCECYDVVKTQHQRLLNGSP